MMVLVASPEFTSRANCHPYKLKGFDVGLRFS